MSVRFKHEKDKELILSLHPALLMIFFDLAFYAKEKHDVDLMITSTISTPAEDLALKRTSKSHQKGLALDIRSKDMNVYITQDIIEYINNKEEYKKYRYMSFSGISRLAYLHVGNYEHIHLAIHSSFGDK